jgi:LysB family phage lysis regulatory protein
MLSQLRLYIFGGVVIAFLALAGVALWYRGEAISATAARDKAKADLSTAVSVNRAQEETIGRLRVQAALNDRILAELSDTVTGINDKLTETTKALTDLKGEDATVRSYLDTPVPAALGRLYNGKPAGGAAADHQGKSAGGSP